MTCAFSEDISQAKEALATLPRVWEGKKSVLELKEADYNWRQMEWWAFYFSSGTCLENLTGIRSTRRHIPVGGKANSCRDSSHDAAGKQG